MTVLLGTRLLAHGGILFDILLDQEDLVVGRVVEALVVGEFVEIEVDHDVLEDVG